MRNGKFIFGVMGKTRRFTPCDARLAAAASALGALIAAGGDILATGGSPGSGEGRVVKNASMDAAAKDPSARLISVLQASTIDIRIDPLRTSHMIIDTTFGNARNYINGSIP